MLNISCLNSICHCYIHSQNGSLQYCISDIMRVSLMTGRGRKKSAPSETSTAPPCTSARSQTIYPVHRGAPRTMLALHWHVCGTLIRHVYAIHCCAFYQFYIRDARLFSVFGKTALTCGPRMRHSSVGIWEAGPWLTRIPHLFPREV